MKLQAALFVLVIQLIGKFTSLMFFSKVECVGYRGNLSAKITISTLCQEAGKFFSWDLLTLFIKSSFFYNLA